MENILDKDYASFMEKVLSDMVSLPVEGICVVTKFRDGATALSFYNSSQTDKILYAGMIQQDAMMDVLKANRMLRENDPEE